MFRVSGFDLRVFGTHCLTIRNLKLETRNFPSQIGGSAVSWLTEIGECSRRAYELCERGQVFGEEDGTSSMRMVLIHSAATVLRSSIVMAAYL
jgi:hypothetical protein